MHCVDCMLCSACALDAAGDGCLSRVTHWLSLDVKGNVKYGQGYAMQETLQMAATVHRKGWLSLPGAAMHAACGVW